MEATNRLALGRYIAQIRQSICVEQFELAELLASTEDHIDSIERGEQEISLEEAQQIAQALGYSPYVVNIFFGEPVPPLTPKEKKIFLRDAPPGATLSRES